MYIKIMDYIYSQKQVQKNIGQSDTLLSESVKFPDMYIN